MRRMTATAILAGAFAVLIANAAQAAGPLPPEKVPTPLKAWVDWALYGHEDASCPFLSGQPGNVRCACRARWS